MQGAGGGGVSFRIIDIIRRGFFKQRVAIEALEPVIVDRIRFRINAVGMSVVAAHQELKFNRGDRASVCVAKKHSVGTILDTSQVSHAVSSHRWAWLAR
jgi:hypothetical protein